jgi:hypothetical protein
LFRLLATNIAVIIKVWCSEITLHLSCLSTSAAN